MEITSEDAAHPIESASPPGNAPGWRAAEPGIQAVRIFYPSAAAPADLDELRGDERWAHAGVCLALVGGWRAVVSGDRAATVERRSSGRIRRDGRPSRRARGGYGARVDHDSRYKRRSGGSFFEAVAARLTLRSSRPPTREPSHEVGFGHGFFWRLLTKPVRRSVKLVSNYRICRRTPRSWRLSKACFALVRSMLPAGSLNCMTSAIDAHNDQAG